MSCAALTPQQKRTEKNLNNLRALFDGIPIKDIDGKSRNIGKSIVNRYTDTSTSFGKKCLRKLFGKLQINQQMLLLPILLMEILEELQIL